jgi:ABC-2 type transport system ATP-binding protein
LSTASLRLSHVNKKLGSREVLKDVSFEVEPGDIFGYLGPNGAGKTTSIRILLGLLRPDSGSASVLGRDATVDDARRRLGFVLEADGLYENLSASANLAYYARIYGMTRPAATIDAALSLVKLKDRSADKVAIFSKGMRQRLALARAMMHNPDVLVLDEPTAGVDPSGQIEVRQIVLDMAGRQGKTILFSSHNLDEVQRICNRIALVDRGTIKLSGRLDQLQRNMGGGEVVIETVVPLPDPVLDELRRHLGVGSVSRQERVITLVLAKGNIDVPGVVTFLSNRGAGIEQVKRKEASLEEIYTTILKEVEAS